MRAASILTVDALSLLSHERRKDAEDGSIDYPARERVSLSFVLGLRLVAADFRMAGKAAMLGID